MTWKHFIRFSYFLLLLFCAVLLFYGRTYYFAPAAQRARHVLNPVLRQSGTAGHFFAVLGTFFMLLLLLYSLRKRCRFARNWGSLNAWLSAHIFLGFAGPLLVLMHTVFKFSGLVAIAFWSMVLVVASGVVGKFIFELIPRSLSGMELNRIEMEAEEIGLTFEMRKLLPAAHPFWQRLADIERAGSRRSRLEHLHLVFEPAQLRRQLRRLLADLPGLDRRRRRMLIQLVVKRHMIHHKAQLMQGTLRILHYWHLVHQPFVIIMFLILAVHVYVSIRLGYAWIF
jgi:hypothetical protein